MKQNGFGKGLLVLALLLVVTALACRPASQPATSPASPTLQPAVTGAAVQTARETSKQRPEEAAWRETVAAARKEGNVTIYTPFGTPEGKDAINKAMQDNYGVKVQWLGLRGAEGAQRIVLEQKSKQYVADVFWPGFSTLLTNQVRSAGALAHFTPPVAISEPDVWKGKGIRSIADEDDIITLAMNTNYPIIVNTNLVPPGEYPKSHKDLLDPKWKGKIAMTEVSQSGSGSYLFSMLKNELGIGYWEKMKEQNIAFFKDQAEVGRRVATGESAVALSLGPLFITPFLTSGAPIKLLPAAEGGFKTFLPLYLVNNAPDPNAGKVFINFMLTKQGQEIQGRLFNNEPLRKDVEFKTHPEIQSWLDSTPKWTLGDMKTIDEFDADVAAGTAQKVLGLK